MRQAARRATGALTIALAAALLLGAVAVPRLEWTPVANVEFVVNDGQDLPDVDLSDGFCGTDAGTCTLRAAVMEANDLPDGDTATIRVAESVETIGLTIEGAFDDDALTGDLDIHRDVTIVGLGTVIDGGGIDRIFDVFLGSLRLERVTLVDGLTDLSGGGGAIRNVGTLTLEHVQVGTAEEGNVSGAPGGGGINNLGHAEIRQSSFVGNAAASGNGGAIFNDTTGTVHLENVTIADNEATDGGGIYTQSDVSLFFVTLAENRATDGNGNSLMRELAGTFNVVNSIVTSGGQNCSGAFDAASNTNLVSRQLDGVWQGDDSCDTLDELSGADPQFGLLERLDGMDVQTIADTSPAVDAGATEGCPATDQRGVERPQGDACDLGAFEVEQVSPPDYVVNTTSDADDGACDLEHCSLREAINAANESGDHDLIGFDIPGAGPHVIEPGSPLPAITDPVNIDGYTQPGSVENTSARTFNGKLQVVLNWPDLAWDGANAALALQTSDSTIRGILINGGFDTGISVSGSDSNLNVVAGNLIGANQHCQITQARSTEGVTPSTITFTNQSGGAVNVYWLDYEGDEIFYASLAHGASYAQPTWLTHPWVLRTLDGDCVGYELSDALDKTYVIQPPPVEADVRVYGVQIRNGASENTIGGSDPVDRNVISGNTGSSGAGVALVGGAVENDVEGNLIGTDVRGKSAVPNEFGVLVSDSSSNAVRDNVISGNSDDGVHLDADAPNQTRFNQIEDNFIGTDAGGAVALGNGGDGIELQAVGENDVGESGEGSSEDGRNVVADSAGHGIFLFNSADAFVENNYVGTNAAGTAAIGNGIDGIAVDGGADHRIRDNLTSGNTNQGIAIFRVGSLVMPSGVFVQGNKSGTNAAGTGPLPNGGHGILVARANDTTVGGVGDGRENTAAFNGGIGIAVAAEGTGNRLRGNFVHDNGGLGIDLVPEGGPNGVTDNDGFDTDTGPNNLQNFPVLTSVTPELGGTIAVRGELDSPFGPRTFTLDYYASAGCDASGHGEGARHLGSASFSIDRGEFGMPTFTSTGIEALAAGEVLTATATDALNNTSEFSPCLDTTATVTIALSADTSVEAGARRVQYADVPLSVFSRATAATGGSRTSAPLDAIPLDAIPLDAIPLDAIPLDAIPLDAIPLDAIGLGSAVLEASLGGLPLTLVPLNPVSVPGGWDAVLAQTVLANRPTVTITLAEVFALDSLPTKPNTDPPVPLSLADIDLSSSVLGDLPLAALVLGPIRLAEIPLDRQSTGEADNLADWCEAIEDEEGFDCDPNTLAEATVMSTSLRGVPLDAIPLDAIPLDAIPLDAIPLDAIPLDAILLRGTPLDAIPLDAIPLDAIPLDAIPLDAIPLDAIGLGALPLDAIPLDAIPLDAIGLGNLPLDAIMAQRATPLDAIPLDAIPLDAIPLDAIGSVVNCATYACTGKTLGQAYKDGALRQGALLRHLDDALGQLTLADLGFYGDVSVGHLDFYGDVTLGQLREYGDLTLGDLLAHVPGLTVGDVLLALLAPEAYPWEKVSYGRLDPARYATDGSRVTYAGAFEIAGNATSVPVTVSAELPDGFSFVPGTATLQSVAVVDGLPVSGITLIDDPAIDGNTLTFAFDSIARDADYTVRVEARPSIALGIGVGSATAQAGTGPESAPDTAETTITETFPDNGDPDEAPEIAADSYYLSHVTGADDVDYYLFPVLDAGTRVTFHLSHLAADYDLAVYGPNRLAPPRDTGDEGIPLDGVPLADEPADLQPLGDSLTPEALDDVPLLDDRPLWGLSINREKEDEAVAVMSNGEGGGESYYTIQVSGYNGAASPIPYMLRAQVQPARELPDCLPRDLSLGLPGTSVNHLSNDLDTVFLVNVQRLQATYADADVALGALQNNLAALESLGAKSAIVALDASQSVRNAYTAWDENPCSPHLANRVVNAATDVLDDIRAYNPGLKHVVLVGGDDLLPHARIDDATTYANESQHAGTFRQGDQYLGAFANYKLLTDNPYGTVRPIRFFNRHLYVPELRVGRLVEKPADIAHAIETFVRPDVAGVLSPQTAFTTGYDFLSDGAQAIDGELEQLVGSGATSRIDEEWTSEDVRGALKSPNPPAIASINAHYDHHRSLPADENAAGTTADLFTTADLRNPPTPNLDRRLLFTMGCHAGLSLSDVVVGSTVPSLDWAQALSENGAAFAGNTGFGLGDDTVVGYTERLLALFAEELRHAETIASALDRAKRRYLALQGVVGVYDEKVISQMTLYGLPMWRIRAGQQPPAPPQPPPAQTDPITGLAASSFDVDPTFTRQPTGVAPRGNYYTVGGGDVQATHFRPLQPRLHLPVQPNAHGALVTTLASVDEGNDGGWFDPIYSRPTTDHSSREPEIVYGDTAFPTKIQTVTRGPDGSSLVLLVGQFFTPEGAPAGMGTQRRFTDVEGLVYGSASDEWAPPRFDRIDGVKIGSQIAFTVVADDPGLGPANVKRVYVLFRDASNEWHGLDLVRGTGTLWTGGAPLVGDQIEYFVQAVDAAGNVAVSTRKGRYFDARPATALPDGLLYDLHPVAPGVETPSGWFTGAVDVELVGPEPLEVSVDGGPFERYGTPRVSGDGAHTVDVRGPEGLAATIVVPIDGTAPTVTITSPAAGAVVVHGSTVDAVFDCSDAGSGIASCTASSDPVDTTTVGSKTLTVTATDAAGNTASVQRSYTVVHPDILFSSSRTGHGDIYSVSSEDATAAPQQVTSGPAIDAEPDWFPGEQRLAFTRVVGNNVEIFAVDMDGTDLVRLTNNSAIDTSPAVSPDGKKIAFASNRGGNWDVYVMDAATGANVKRLTTHKEVDALPAWSPDGLAIAFSSGRTGDGDIYKMTATGGSQTRVTSGTSAARIDTEPTWVGNRIVFSSNRDGSFDLYTIPAAGGATTRLTTEAGHHVTPSASRDGTRIVFASNRPGGTLNFDLYTMNADGTSPTALVVHPSIDAFPDW